MVRRTPTDGGLDAGFELEFLEDVFDVDVDGPERQLYSMNLDMMIHGGRELPEELKASSLKVRDTILAIIMEGGASGEP